MTNHFRKVSTFGIVTAVNLTLSLIAIPIIIHIAGDIAWASIAVAQSVGQFAAVLVSYGWGLTGPAEVAQLPPGQRGEYFAGTFSSRMYLLAMALLPVVALIFFLDRGGEQLASILSGLAVLLSGLSAPWFYIGESRPDLLLWLDAAPRAFGVLIGLLLLVLSGSLALYAAVQLLASFVVVTASFFSVRRRYGVGPRRVGHSPREAARRLRGARHSMTTSVTAALYVNAPVIIVSAVAPHGAAVYVLADKFLKMGQKVLGPFGQFLQGWVPTAHDPGLLAHRIRRATSISVLVATIAAVAFATMLPWAADVFSLGQVAVPYSVSLPLALALLSVTISSTVGLACLIPLGRAQSLAVSTVVGAIVGFPASFVLGTWFEASGVAAAVGCSEAVVCIFQLIVLRKALKQLNLEGNND